MSSALLTLLIGLLPVLIAALLEAAVASLTRLRLSPREPGRVADFVARIASEPRRLRHALALWRFALLGLAFAMASGLVAFGEPVPALALAAALGALYLLDRHGRLRWFGARAPWLAPIGAAAMWPMFALLRQRPEPAGRVAADEAQALADTLATSPEDRQRTVQALLELANVTVEDIMVPRHEVTGIDLDDSWEDILEQLGRVPHTRLPLYEGELDRVIGVVHMKRIAQELARGTLDRDRLRELATSREALFVPEGTTLEAQLSAFRQLRRRVAFVVDEYGDVRGLVTLEDILGEVVGDFTSSPAALRRDALLQPDGSYVIAGAASLRDLNRGLGWNLPTDGPRTLSGAIIEYLEAIPESGTSLMLGNHPVEILQTGDNMVRTVRVWPPRQA